MLFLFSLTLEEGNIQFFHSEVGDALEQVARGGCGCPIPGGIQGQTGWDPGQSDLLVGSQPMARRLHLGDL